MAAVHAVGKESEQVTPDDLAPATEFHTWGKEATLELSRRAGRRARRHLTAPLQASSDAG